MWARLEKIRVLPFVSAEHDMRGETLLPKGANWTNLQPSVRIGVEPLILMAFFKSVHWRQFSRCVGIIWRWGVRRWLGGFCRFRCQRGLLATSCPPRVGCSSRVRIRFALRTTRKVRSRSRCICWAWSRGRRRISPVRLRCRGIFCWWWCLMCHSFPSGRSSPFP